MRSHPPLLLLLRASATGCPTAMDHEPDVKSNPHPVQRYELIVTVDSPGPWDKVSGEVSYDISNEKCIRYNAFEGVHMRPAPVGREFVLTKVDAHTYRGYFYRDALEGSDYYGKGTCHWDVGGVGPTFVAHGLTFSTWIGLDTRKPGFGDALDGSTATEWLKKKEYFDQSLNDTKYGQGMVSSENDASGEWFSVTMTTRRVRP